MSLTDWVEWDRDLFNSLFDKPRFDLKGELKAPPLTKNYGTVGTAFDYALRFLISREHSLLQSNHWVAHNSLNFNSGYKRKEFIKTTEKKVQEYTFGNILSIFDLLPDCITLAKLDVIFRTGRDFPDNDIFHIDKEDVKDLNNLINLVDIELFKARRICFLNPTFGQSSKDIGGADADLVIDNCLIDIKTTKYLEFKKEHFRQLMGYYLLNLRENNILGQLNELGIYFSRYGILFKFDPEPIYLEGLEFRGRILHENHLPFIEPDPNLFKCTHEFLYPHDSTDFEHFLEKHLSYFSFAPETIGPLLAWEEIEDSIKEYQEA